MQGPEADISCTLQLLSLFISRKVLQLSQELANLATLASQFVPGISCLSFWVRGLLVMWGSWWYYRYVLGVEMSCLPGSDMATRDPDSGPHTCTHWAFSLTHTLDFWYKLNSAPSGDRGIVERLILLWISLWTVLWLPLLNIEGCQVSLLDLDPLWHGHNCLFLFLLYPFTFMCDSKACINTSFYPKR